MSSLYFELLKNTKEKYFYQCKKTGIVCNEDEYLDIFDHVYYTAFATEFDLDRKFIEFVDNFTVGKIVANEFVTV